MKSNLIYIKKHELFKDLDLFREGEFFAIIDYKVRNHLPQWILFSTHVFWVKNPEGEKNLDYFSRAVEFFLEEGITRASVLYAIGGGATTDLAGFVAATLLRGIDWVAIPTTLLAMVDASIGGKVAVNMPQGKNLLGSFHFPLKIYVCTEFLSSLPDIEWMSGKGEILKYGFLSKEINDLILQKAPVEEIAPVCARYKNDIVEKDFLEKGERIYLNLGHTLGHAFELSLNIPHGFAVALGIKYIFKVMKNEKLLKEWEKMVLALDFSMQDFDLKKMINFKLDKFLNYLEQDKKKSGAKIRLVLVKDIENCYLEELFLKDFKEKILEHEDFRDQ